MTQSPQEALVKTWKEKSITVLTITRRRPRLLRRAIASVSALECDLPVYHLVMVDACRRTWESLEKTVGFAPNGIRVLVYCARSSNDFSGPGRSAILRNRGVDMTPSEWVAFLDDDNEFESNHLQSLIRCAIKHGCDAVHSYRQVFYRSGKPYMEERDPWEQDECRAREVYDQLVAAGVRLPGSNVFRDRLDTAGTPGGVYDVDTGEWLFRRRLIQAVRFCEVYYEDDKRNGLWGEDLKLSRELARLRILVASTQKATLRYYLGGYSNCVGNGPPNARNNRT